LVRDDEKVFSDAGNAALGRSNSRAPLENPINFRQEEARSEGFGLRSLGIVLPINATPPVAHAILGAC
jgi:hypothetical protein